MTIGALCGHMVASGIFEVEHRLPAESVATVQAKSSPSYSGPRIDTGYAEGGAMPATTHAFIPLDRDDPVHAAVRSSAAVQALEGVNELASRASAALDGVRADVEATSLDLVIDCWGLPLRFGDFLRGRILELVVHADDLACSIGAESSGVPHEAIELACSLGISVAIRRNGATPVLRALFRSDMHSRDPLRPF
jgi:hypothetical protein